MLWEYVPSYETLEGLGISIGIFILFLFFRKIFTKYVFHFILKITKKTPTDFFTNVSLAFEHPIRWFFLIVGLYLSVEYFPYIDQTNPFFLSLIRASIIILITWGLYNLAAVSTLLLVKINNHLNIEVDQILIPFLSKAIRFVILAISASVIAQEFGYDVNGFIAGLGLGGLAIALAAKDALGNLFGGVVIIMEKPFSIGDWIMTPSVEGTVEDINFRSTKIRTFAQGLVTVPNATLANEAITNWSKMGKRRITFHLGVTLNTPKNKLEKSIRRIETLLKNHVSIHQDTIFVTFDKYSESSLDIFLYFFTKTTDWEEYLKVREEINFEILEILEDEDVSIALPSRILHISSLEKRGTNI